MAMGMVLASALLTVPLGSGVAYLSGLATAAKLNMTAAADIQAETVAVTVSAHTAAVAAISAMAQPTVQLDRRAVPPVRCRACCMMG